MKNKRSTSEPQRKECWYQLVSFFETDGKSIMSIDGENVLLSGWLPPDYDCAVVVVPTSVTQEQGIALQRLMEANLRHPVLVLTNNTQLVRLKPISDQLAESIMRSESNANSTIIAIAPGGGKEQANSAADRTGITGEGSDV